jgi:alpha-tubulin suppressor-like RCC1 family protein
MRLDDLYSDGLIALGLEKYDPRTTQTKNIVERAKQKYNTNDINLYGHSLGGNQVSGIKTDGNIYTYNKAASINSIGKKIPDNQYDYRNSNDIISNLSLLERNKNLKTKFNPFQNSIDAHNLKHAKNIKI